jgi:hypothetical protein
MLGGVEATQYRGRTVEHTALPAAGRRHDPRLEQIQREHELSSAYDAALALQHRLEFAGLNDLAATTRRIREGCAEALHALHQEGSSAGRA